MNTNKKKIIYTAYSKFNFYLKDHISIHVIKNGFVPLNPFSNWGYFMSDTVERNLIREANFNLLRLANELWVFGIISNGVAAEIDFATKNSIKVKFFDISENGKRIKETKKANLGYESNAFDRFPKLKVILDLE